MPMNDVVEPGLDELWASASDEALQRTTHLARNSLRGAAALLCSFSGEERIVRYYNDPEDVLKIGVVGSTLCRRVFEDGVSIADPDFMQGQRAVRGYAGVPVRTSAGTTIGIFCVLDVVPHDWTTEDLDLLAEFAASLASQIELRHEVQLRQKAEQALLASKARFMAVADNIPGVVFERRKVDATNSTYTFFGSNKKELPAVQQMSQAGIAGRMSFIHPDDRDMVRGALVRSTIDESDLDLTFRVMDFDRTTRWLRSQSMVRRTTDGAVIWDGLCFDITDLVASKEDAEATRAEKETYLVNINHELRAPLQAIVGFTEFLKTEKRPNMIAAHARTIQSAAKSLLAIINQTLDRAGSEAVVPASIPEIVNLHDFANTCLSMVGPLAIEKKLTSHLRIADDVPPAVLLEQQKIRQALLNLLSNAVKFTDVGDIALDISRLDDHLRFAIADSGIGIPSEKQGLLFQRFSRIEGEGRTAEGTGLGLAITKDLVESLGGRIDVASDQRGTTFWFDIPLLAAVEATGAPLAPIVENRPHSPKTGARILLADDLDLNRKLIADMLSIEGHSVDCVADGAAAVAAVRERAYDLVLMDMMMPGMDGMAATRAIRALPHPICDVPVLALTAHSFREQLDSCLEAGMNATLTKPMSFDALTDAVARWTGQNSQAA